MKKKFKKPFDVLVFDPHFELYVCALKHQGKDVRFEISCNDSYSIDDALPIAEEIWNRRKSLFKSFADSASNELLDAINDRLAQINDTLAPDKSLPKELSKSGFQNLLAVPSAINLVLESDQTYFTISSHNKSFGDHGVSVTFDQNGDVMYADINNLY